MRIQKAFNPLCYRPGTPPDFIFWNLMPKCDDIWAGDYIMRVEPSCMLSVPYKRDSRELPQIFHHTRLWWKLGCLWMRKQTPTRHRNLPDARSWAFHLPELWKINPNLIFHDGSPNRLCQKYKNFSPTHQLTQAVPSMADMKGCTDENS